MTGLTSITFRTLSCEKVIELTRQAGLDGIEWGSDIHVPEGDAALAEKIWAQTAKAGLRVISYGSYYRLGANENPRLEFTKYLNSAVALHAPIIRIWAGNAAAEDISEVEFLRLAAETRTICAMAEEKGITVAFEYHRGTMTETSSGALQLLQTANCANLRTYWQPNPDISFEENKRELEEIRPYLANVHVFHWIGANVRYPLEEGAEYWEEYISISRSKQPSYLLEFVKDDSVENLMKDAAALRALVCGE